MPFGHGSVGDGAIFLDFTLHRSATDYDTLFVHIGERFQLAILKERNCVTLLTALFTEEKDVEF